MLSELNEEDQLFTAYDSGAQEVGDELWDRIQRVYTRLTGISTDWTREAAEPWWSLGGAFRGL